MQKQGSSKVHIGDLIAAAATKGKGEGDDASTEGGEAPAEGAEPAGESDLSPEEAAELEVAPPSESPEGTLDEFVDDDGPEKN
jgi:hypothetical protein